MAFFTTERRDGMWTLVDSEGKPFYSLGINCMNCNLMEPMAPGFDFVAKYGGRGCYERWGETKLREVRELGFNSLGAWNASLFWSSAVPKTVEIRMSRTADHIFPGWGGYGFPDVFADSFRHSAHQAVLDTLYHHGHDLVGDESLIGYYTDNELHWWGTGGQWGQSDPGGGANDTSLVDDFIRLPAHKPGKRAWVAYLADRYGGDVAKLNEAWNSEYLAFDDLLALKEARTVKDVFEADKLGFLGLIAETYFRTTTEALRLYDRHHLILGCRTVGTGTPEVVLDAMARYTDVFTVNFYTFDLPEEWLRRTHERMGKPIMVTEFSFCAGRTAGYPLSTNGAQLTLVPDQKRRGESYRSFVALAARLPYMIGTHWFALYDFGNENGLIGNYGIYDASDELWQEFAGYVKMTHEELAAARFYRAVEA